MWSNPPLNITALRLLLAVAETGSIGQAAEALQISQPAASKRVASLERSLGILLIVRSTKGSTLTAEGQAVADWARRVIETVDEMLGAVAAMTASNAIGLRVASSLTLAEQLVPEWLSRLRWRFPELHISLRVANSQQVQELVAKGKADLGFVETPLLDMHLNAVQVARDELVVIVSPNHAWARRTHVTKAELAKGPLIVREPGSGTRDTLSGLMGNVSAHLEMNTNAAIKSAVIAGAGAAALSRLAVASDLSAGRLVEIPVAGLDLRRSLSAVWPHHVKPKGAAEALLTLARASPSQAVGAAPQAEIISRGHPDT
jgi:DNA-binding transcriptional LysR family regulator